VQQIEIDFEVFKALTARRRSETHTYNQVIRELLDIDSGVSVHEEPQLIKNMKALAALPDLIARSGPTTGFALRGLVLPNGTLLRATHKGSAYHAQIVDGEWVNDDGQSYTSPSSAASAITGNNVNGWRFWQAKRPSDTDWRNLDMLPKS
jgi:hypothetical protein